MIKKTITYTDYDDVERTEDFYFHLNKGELLEWELSQDGGVENFVKKIISSQNRKQLVELWKWIILKSYGEKSDDGRRFIKSEELSKAFTETEAYSQLFVELSTNTEAATAFINGIVPGNLSAAMEDAAKAKEEYDQKNKNNVTKIEKK